MLNTRIAEFFLLMGRGVLLGVLGLLIAVLGTALPLGLQWLLPG
jgi:hypothetical protein